MAEKHSNCSFENLFEQTDRFVYVITFDCQLYVMPLAEHKRMAIH